MTLVEVLAALAILGSLLAGLLMARAGLTRQWADAEHKQAAIGVADELLVGWWDSREGIPVGKRGELNGQPGWWWRVQRLEESPPPEFSAIMVRLELFDEHDRILTSVDLIDHAPPKETEVWKQP